MNLLIQEAEKLLVQTIISIVDKTIKSAVKDDEIRYLRQKDVLRYAGGISKDTLRRWVVMGLKEIKVGNVVMYDKQDIDRFMIQHKI